MKLTEEKARGYAMAGNRSPKYFGINLMLDQKYFNITRDGAEGAERCDPRIAMFSRSEQTKARFRLMDAAERHGISISDGLIKWKSLVVEATAIVTDAWNLPYGGILEPRVPFSSECREEMLVCYRKGRAFLNALIPDLYDCALCWDLDTTGELDLQGEGRTPRNVPAKLRFEVLNENRKKHGTTTCELCADVAGPFHVDHIISLLLGGTNARQNLQVLCADCNLSKGGTGLWH